MSNLPTDLGPYETDQQAAETTRGAYAVLTGAPHDSMNEFNRERLAAACAVAGVELGTYDRRVLEWLARWEPETCAVVAGLIARAGAAR